MAEKIIWSPKAKNELIEIFQYWINRNKSKVYSTKLNQLIEEQLKSLLRFPKSGKETDISNVYVKIIKSYLLYYEVKEDILYIRQSEIAEEIRKKSK